MFRYEMPDEMMRDQAVSSLSVIPFLTSSQAAQEFCFERWR